MTSQTHFGLGSKSMVCYSYSIRSCTLQRSRQPSSCSRTLCKLMAPRETISIQNVTSIFFFKKPNKNHGSIMATKHIFLASVQVDGIPWKPLKYRQPCWWFSFFQVTHCFLLLYFLFANPFCPDTVSPLSFSNDSCWNSCAFDGLNRSKCLDL